jgi:hypothetical protein
MSFVLRVVRFFVSIYRWFVTLFRNWRIYRLEYVSEEPTKLRTSTVYAVGENGHIWHVTFLCPCRCGAPISLNMLPDDSPRWHLSVHGDTPTLTPSVRRQVGCRSHFFLRRGRVDWCRR